MGRFECDKLVSGFPEKEDLSLPKRIETIALIAGTMDSSLVAAIRSERFLRIRAISTCFGDYSRRWAAKGDGAWVRGGSESKASGGGCLGRGAGKRLRLCKFS
jgi:hypothetical protein